MALRHGLRREGMVSQEQVTAYKLQHHSLPFVADGFDCAAAAGLEPVSQLLQVGCGDPGQQGLGELGLILTPHHEILVLEVMHILIPQILQSQSIYRSQLLFIR